jgi:hypothetical protein
MSQNVQNRSADGFRYLVIGVLVLGAFFGAYRFALASNGADASQAVANSGFAGAPAGGGAGCACCDVAPPEDGISGERLEGAATLSGDVQTIDVDQSAGYYQPNVIFLKAGVPAEITFGQGAGCTAQVMSQELDFYVDVTGGPETVTLPGLAPGEYPFYCGMQMLYGKIVVE